MLVDLNRASIPTWTELQTLMYCRSIALRSTLVIESGTYMGASARAMIETNPGCHLWCVDKFEVFGTREITELFLNQWIRKGQCEIIQGDMDKAGEMLTHMTGKIDAVWVDDGHAEEDLRRDIRNALPLLRPGGILFGHDWDGDNDVARGVLSMLPKDKLTFPVPRVWQYIKP
jgi:predicted O-methyltransferase YrrM